MSELMKKMLAMKSGIVATQASVDDLLMVDKFCPTSVPIINIAMSGDVDGGIPVGATVFAGPSKHYKTLYALLGASAFQKEEPNGLVLFYNNEFGVNRSYFERTGIDMSRVLHLPFKAIEEVSLDVIPRLDGLADDEKVFILIDSIGMSASKKELADVLAGKEKEDMTRAKKIKQLFRLIVPYLNIKQISMIAVAQYYESQDKFHKKILGGGQGVMLGCNNVFYVERVALQSEGDTNDREYKIHDGYDFYLYTEKSRYAVESRKFPIRVTWAGGVATYSGLSQMAERYKIIEKVNRGRYGTWFVLRIEGEEDVLAPVTEKVDKETGDITESIENNAEFWNAVFEKTDFKERVKAEYRQN